MALWPLVSRCFLALYSSMHKGHPGRSEHVQNMTTQMTCTVALDIFSHAVSRTQPSASGLGKTSLLAAGIRGTKEGKLNSVLAASKMGRNEMFSS